MTTTAKTGAKIAAGTIVITREHKLARVAYLYREEGVEFAALRYLDGSNPHGNGAIDPERGLCEHRVRTGLVVGPGARYWDNSRWTPEEGLRRATPANLKRAANALDTAQQRAILRQHPTARKVRAMFPMLTRVAARDADTGAVGIVPAARALNERPRRTPRRPLAKRRHRQARPDRAARRGRAGAMTVTVCHPRGERRRRLRDQVAFERAAFEIAYAGRPVEPFGREQVCRAMRRIDRDALVSDAFVRACQRRVPYALRVLTDAERGR